ncbi:MAG: Tm-1-like ATP-binding domain-containing protein [Propionibacteriaceae bacterium]|nr:Tm-1-like ATP-binding domain-containing protein [Propionibacteriaceae bacterium]
MTAVLCALDTKGEEARFAAAELRSCGVVPLVIDIGILRDPDVAPDIPATRVAEAGGTDLQSLRERRDVHGGRSSAISTMAAGAAVVLRELVDRGRVHSAFGLGGGEGSTIVSAAMRALPIGFPKLLLSTMLPDNIGPYFGVTDLCVMHSVTDIAGLNRISRPIISNAARAAAGMAQPGVGDDDRTTDPPLVAVTMFGTTTAGGDRIRELLEGVGFETVVFHAVGSGGRAMESLVDAGVIEGVVDLTPSEITDAELGGIFTAGPHRMEAAGRKGLPQVVAPGALAQITFGGPDSVPEKYREGHLMLAHSPSVTIVRADEQESARVADVLADKVLAARGPIAVAVPRGGISDYERPGAPLADAEADEAIFRTLRARLDGHVPYRELSADINSAEFAQLVSSLFLEAWVKSGRPLPGVPTE